jgi:hypothetical protein
MMDLVLEEMLQDRGDAAGRRRAVGTRQDEALGEARSVWRSQKSTSRGRSGALRVVEPVRVGVVRRRVVVALSTVGSRQSASM